MPCSGIEERRRTRHVVMRGEQAVKINGLVDCERKPAGYAQEKVLRRLDDFARDGMTQQVAVINRSQPKVLKSIRESFIDGIISLRAFSETNDAVALPISDSSCPKPID